MNDQEVNEPNDEETTDEIEDMVDKPDEEAAEEEVDVEMADEEVP